MLKRILQATSAIVAVTGVFAIQSASAADMPVKAPAMVLDPWTGAYIGVHAGVAAQRSCNTFTPEGALDPVNDLFLAGLVNGCSDPLGFIGGAQIGVNQRIGNWVWGLEGDLSGLTTKTVQSMTGISAGGRTITEVETAKLNAMGTIGPRVGVLLNPGMLLYATGGLAMARVSADGGGTQSAPAAGAQFLSHGNIAQWTPGWTLGGGLEWRLNGPWSLKAEYLYARFRSVNYDEVNQIPTNVGTGLDNIVSNVSVQTQLHIVRVGLNYALGAPSSAIQSAAMPMTYNWTGFYFGGHVGYAHGTTRSQEPSTEAVPGAGPWLAFNSVTAASAKGTMGGAQFGYNWQAQSLVLGVEGDFGYLGFGGQASSPLFAGTFTQSTGGLYGAVRGRLGFAWDRFLVYGTGGWIAADVGGYVSNPTVITPGDGLIVTGKTGVQNGAVYGGGVEYALGAGWSVKGEYLHFNLDTVRVAGNGINFGLPNTYAFDMKSSGDVVRIGVNKKLF